MDSSRSVNNVLQVELDQLQTLESAYSKLVNQHNDDAARHEKLTAELKSWREFLHSLETWLERSLETRSALNSLSLPPLTSMALENVEGIPNIVNASPQELASRHQYCLLNLQQSITYIEEQLKAAQDRVATLANACHDSGISLNLVEESRGRFERDIVTLKEQVTRIRMVNLHTNRMPDIIIRQIFEELIESMFYAPEDAHRVFHNKYHRHAMQTMASICKRWRIVAQASTRLWRHIYLSPIYQSRKQLVPA